MDFCWSFNASFGKDAVSPRFCTTDADSLLELSLVDEESVEALS